MYVRLAELPLYLSLSPTDGGFKRMKEGYFRQQALSAPVEEVRSAAAAAAASPLVMGEEARRATAVCVHSGR